MKKRSYRAVSVKDACVGLLREQVAGRELVVGIDAAKTHYFAALVLKDGDRHVLSTLKWEHPRETRSFVELLLGLGAQRLEAALEPTGTYGVPVVELLRAAGIDVFQVSAKRAHDAAEVYDGVPSQHDAKSAAIIATLHREGRSRCWPFKSDEQRTRAAAIGTMNRVQQALERALNQLEAMLGEYWPEVLSLLPLDSASLLALLEHFGSPAKIALALEQAHAVAQRVSKGALAPEKITAVLEAAAQTSGLKMITAEIKALGHLVCDIQRDKNALAEARKLVRSLGAQCAAVREMTPVLGAVTATVLVSEVGEPSEFGSAAAFVKVLGLNLKERSSGNKKGQLSISKRGSGLARKYLFLATLRLVQRDAVARAWHEAKVARDGGRVRKRSIVAVMRKLTRALWHVGRGAGPFDSRKLFDVRRLGLAEVASA